MSEARFDRVSNENNTAGPIISGITTFSGQNFFVPPKGTTAQRPSNCPVGSIRFNTDSAKLEYFDSLQWLEMEAFNVEIGISTNAAGTSGGLGTRGVIAGGQTPTVVNTIDYITISTTGNAISFGNLSTARLAAAAVADSTRGLIQGGGAPTITNTTRRVTISSTGSETNFGNLITSFYGHFGCANSTRGVFGGSYSTSYTNILEYVTIQSDGTAADFGDVSVGSYRRGNIASSTRGVLMGNYAPGGDAYSNFNIIEFITISTLGNAADFGDLTQTMSDCTSSSNSTRGLRFGKWPAENTIDYITIATLGNAQNFGDLTVSRYDLTSTTSPTRAVICGGAGGGVLNTIDYVNILSLGDAIDFGDLPQTKRGPAALSNGHGGL